MKKKIYFLFSVVCAIIFFIAIILNFFIFPRRYKNYVTIFCNEYNLDRALVYAIIKAESDFDKNAISKSGAIGLMQLLPKTAGWIADKLKENFSADNLFEPKTNIKYGCFYINYLENKFSDMDAVICAYNAGETKVLDWLDEDRYLIKEKISYEETKNYLKRVKKYYNFYSVKEVCI